MICTNASTLYLAMHRAVRLEQFERRCTDPESVQTSNTYEAAPDSQFELSNPHWNVQACVPMDRRWAIANALHFFAGTEEAEMLINFHPHANKYVVDGKWHGAYGAIAMPQIAVCVARLREYPTTRRAIVSMGDGLTQDMHRPACWSFLQFLNCRKGLYMSVYQRSLHLSRVMPYDLIVLSNLLMYVARETGKLPASLIWTIGSLHTQDLATVGHSTGVDSLILNMPPSECLSTLRNSNHPIFTEVGHEAAPVRTR